MRKCIALVSSPTPAPTTPPTPPNKKKNNNIIELPKYCPSHLSNPIIRFHTTDCICHFGTNLKNPNGKGRKKKKAPTIVTTRIFRNYGDYLG